MPELLTPAERHRVDDRPDSRFYRQPRLVQHVDAAFRDRLRAVYATHLEPGDDVLDLMSSWVSHLPDESYGRVIGHGLNATELSSNDRLTDAVVSDLNAVPALPFTAASFDAVVCAVSVQYLQHPGPVFADVRRVLRDGGRCVVSFSNRLFPTKAIRAWRERSMDERALLVARYLEETAFVDVAIRREPDRPGDPFYAVVASAP